MVKLDSPEELAKAAKSIGSFFSKQAATLEKEASLHTAAGAAHAGMAAAHAEHAAVHKATHDSLPNDHELKSHFHKSASHHTQMATHHEACAKAFHAHADSMKTEIDALKAMAADWGVTKADGAVSSLFTRTNGTITAPPTTPTGNVMADMVNEASAALMAKTLSMMDSDPACQQLMREQVMAMVSEAIGKTVVPSNVSAVTPVAAPGSRAVARAGQPPITPAAAAAAVEKVPLEFRKFVSVEDGEEERPIL